MDSPPLTYPVAKSTAFMGNGGRRLDRAYSLRTPRLTSHGQRTMEPLGLGERWPHEAKRRDIDYPYYRPYEWPEERTARGCYSTEVPPVPDQQEPRSGSIQNGGGYSGPFGGPYSTHSQRSSHETQGGAGRLYSPPSEYITTPTGSFLPTAQRAYQYASQTYHSNFRESHTPSYASGSLSPLDHYQSYGSMYSPYSEDYSQTPSSPSDTSLAIAAMHQWHIQPPHHRVHPSHPDARQGTREDINPIRITVQPVDCTVKPRGQAYFKCEASLRGTDGELNFLWYKDYEPLVGEINEEYVLEEATKQDAGIYFCVISDPSEEYVKRTDTAQLIVKVEEKSGDTPETQLERPSPPIILAQPEAYVEVESGERLTVVLDVIGTPPLEFKWYKDTNVLRYATSSVLEIPNANQLDSGQYCCSVGNAHGSTLSDPFQVKVLRRASGKSSHPRKPLAHSRITGVPTSQPSRPTSFDRWSDQPLTDRFLKEVAVQLAKQVTSWSRMAMYFGLSNAEIVSSRMHYPKPEDQAYQMLRTWKAKSNGDRSKLLTILALAGMEVSGLNPCAPTSPAKPVRRPIVCVQPEDQRVIYGQTARLIIELDNPDYCTTYQWYRNGEPMHGKTSPELLFHSTVDSDSGEYFCKVTNQGGTTNSNPARIKVVDLDPHGGGARHGRVQPDLWRFMQSQLQSRGAEDGGECALLHRGPTEAPTRTDQLRLMGGQATDTARGDKPKIIKQPQPQEVEAGDPLTLVCQATGSTDLTYLWYFNGLSLKDETRSEYTLNCFTDEDEGMYQCEVANSWGRVMSDMVEVKMKAIENA